MVLAQQETQEQPKQVFLQNASLPDVLLLAAGYGRRLRPLTDKLPKPLVAVNGKPLLVYHLERLASLGFRRVFINVHHLADQIVEYVGSGESWDLEVVFSWEQELLDTGGALRPIASVVSSDSLLIINADSLFLDPPDIMGLLQLSQSEEPRVLASMMVREDIQASCYGSLALGSNAEVVRFLDVHKPGVEQDTVQQSREVMYCGIMHVRSEILDWLPPRSICSITKDCLKPAVAAGQRVRGLVHSGRWYDVGTSERLAEARSEALQLTQEVN